MPTNPLTDPSVGAALQTLSVGAPGAPGAQPPSPTKRTIPFSEFYASVGGDPLKAEALIPGITAPDGYKMLTPGPDGRPHVEVDHNKARKEDDRELQQDAPPLSAREIIDRKLAEGVQRRAAIKAAGKPMQHGEPLWLTRDQFAQTLGAKHWEDLPPETILAIAPGIENPNGQALYIRRAPDGGDYLLNPHSREFQKAQAEAAKISARIAADEESR